MSEARNERRRAEYAQAREREQRADAIEARKALCRPGMVVRFAGWALDTPDPYVPLHVGTLGVVTGVDDGGTVHVRWSDGTYLGMMMRGDRFDDAGLLAPKLDGVTHFARNGHTLALCGAERLSNADVDEDVEAWCAECLLIANMEVRDG